MAESIAHPDVTAGQCLRRVLANPSLRRVQLAFFGSVMGDWAYLTAVTVFAYQIGGATAVGAFASVRFLAIAVAGPVGALVADRVSRKAFMMSLDAIRALLIAAAAFTLALDGIPAVVFVLAVVAGMVGAPFRSAQAGLVPRLVSRPEDLTAANAVAGNLENVACFVGPALGALLIGVFDVQAAFWFNVGAFGWSLLMVSAARVPASEVGAGAAATGAGESSRRFLAEVAAGFAAVGRSADLRLVAGLACAQTFVRGALTVQLVLIAVDMLNTGPSGVGYLNALMGVGAVLGGIVVLTRTAKGWLARDMVAGVLGWTLPLVLLAAVPGPVTAIVVLLVIGLMDPWVNVGLDTIPQRLAGDRVLSRVFAAIDSTLVASMALGAAVAPLLVAWLGLRPSLLAVALPGALIALAVRGRAKRSDARLTEPAALPLLRQVGLFSPLAPATLEALGHRVATVRVAAGEAVVREGDLSDRFYVIAAGRVEVTQEGRVLRVEEPGDVFGEIGLLRDVVRTATVTALTETRLLALGRDDFLAAVTGAADARQAAEDLASRRLGI